VLCSTSMSGELHSLRERAKELRCLYRVGSATAQRDEVPATVFEATLAAIPDGWQRPESTRARIRYLGRSYEHPGFVDTHAMEAPLLAFGARLGTITIADVAWGGEGDPFLPEEHELLRCIAGRLGEYLEWKQQELSHGRIGATGDHWGWRSRFVERLAEELDRERFGVDKVFIYGSVESGSAGPSSDVDLWVVCTGSESQRHELALWLDGWSRCLAEVAFQHTGTRIRGGMLDVTITGEEPPVRERVMMRAI
jgi:hypothetical protein